MKNKELFKLIENKKETKGIFRASEQKVSSPLKGQMLKFLHMNLGNQKDIFKGFSRFEPKDLQ
jgi:hypothetical protein